MRRILAVLLSIACISSLLTGCENGAVQPTGVESASVSEQAKNDTELAAKIELVFMDADALFEEGDMQGAFDRLGEYPEITSADVLENTDLSFIIEGWRKLIITFASHGHIGGAEKALAAALSEGAFVGVTDEAFAQLCAAFITETEAFGCPVSIETAGADYMLVTTTGSKERTTIDEGVYRELLLLRPDLAAAGNISGSENQPKSEAANMVGSTTANIMEGGIMTMQGNTLYYCKSLYGDNSPDGTGIYLVSQLLEPEKDNRNGTYEPRYRDSAPVNMKKCNPASINAVGEWVYYIHYQDYNDSPDESGICKIKTDGTDWQLVCAGKFGCMYVAGDTIHALTKTEGNVPNIVKMDTSGNVLSCIEGIEYYNFALCGEYYYAAGSNGGILRINHETGFARKIVGNSFGSGFRLIGDSIYYNVKDRAGPVLYRADLDGGNACIIAQPLCFVDWSIFQSDGAYLYYTAMTSIHGASTQFHAFNMKNDDEYECGQLPDNTAKICFAGDYICVMSSSFKYAELERKSESGFPSTADACSYDTMYEFDGQPDHNAVIRNAQELYDRVEAGGGSAALRTQAQQIFSYRQELEKVYAAYDENELYKKIERSLIQTMFSIGCSVAGLIGAAADGASAAAVTADLAKEAANTSVDVLLLKAVERPDDLMYVIANLSNPVSFELFATLHEEADRNNFTYGQAADYIRAYTAAQMDYSTVLLAYVYFEDLLPTGFWERVTDSLANTALAFEEIVDFNGDFNLTYSPDDQQMAKYAKDMLAGASNEFFTAVSAYENETLTRWGRQMINIQQAMLLMLQES